MASTVTVTGKIGPDITATALVINNVTDFGINTTNELLTVVANGKTQQWDISAATTILVTVSGNNYTVTIS